jgi:hypothetical protein
MTVTITAKTASENAVSRSAVIFLRAYRAPWSEQDSIDLNHVKATLAGALTVSNIRSPDLVNNRSAGPLHMPWMN